MYRLLIAEATHASSDFCLTSNVMYSYKGHDFAHVRVHNTHIHTQHAQSCAACREGLYAGGYLGLFPVFKTALEERVCVLGYCTFVVGFAVCQQHVLRAYVMYLCGWVCCVLMDSARGVSFIATCFTAGCRYRVTEARENTHLLYQNFRAYDSCLLRGAQIISMVQVQVFGL